MAAISKIRIDGFKAFPKPFELDLDGRHLLMYGENGSGKSSIFYALHTLLQSQCNPTKCKKYFDVSHKESIVNAFTSTTDPKVEMEFEGSDVVYSVSLAGYKESVSQPISPLRDLNGQCVFINHKFLFNVFSFRNSQYIDLFPVFIKDILPFVLTRDKSEFISEIYDEVMLGIRKRGPRRIDSSFNARIQKFNEETKHVVDLISTNAPKTASKIYNDHFRNVEERELNISLGYDWNDDNIPEPNKSYWLRYGRRYQIVENAGVKKEVLVSRILEILQPSITLKIEEKQSDGSYCPIEKPQTYFNEAKLTAIALSIRFALLDLVSAPNGRFMALDDMLISLDMSNRAKVVDFLLSISDKYKIYLFTNDKSFFEYIKYKSDSSTWLYKEIYMQDDTKKPYLRNSKTYLGNAEHFIRQHEYEIAGNFLRKEAESFCKDFLPKRLQFTEEFVQLDLNGLIRNSKEFADACGLTLTLFDELDEYRKFILNPASHDSYDVVKYEFEVKKCYQTLSELKKISARPIFRKGQKVFFILKTPVPNVDEYKFEITICDEFRLIVQNGQKYLSRGMINYIVYTNGRKGKMQSDNTTLKKFYDSNYQKSDQTESSNYWDSIIDVATGSPLCNII